MRAYALRFRFARSNAREMAAAVEARVRPSDLVVICPKSVPSSFNFYFRPDNTQIDFPEERHVGAIGKRRRLAAVGRTSNYEAVVAQLDQAHREGRRVWFVMGTPRLP